MADKEKIEVGSSVARTDLAVRRTKKFGDTIAEPGDTITVVGQRSCSMIGARPEPRGYYWLTLYSEGASQPHTCLWSDGHTFSEGDSEEVCKEKSGWNDFLATRDESQESSEGYTLDDILAALNRMVPADFKSDGSPKAAAVSREVGMSVTKADRDEAFGIWEESQKED